MCKSSNTDMAFSITDWFRQAFFIPCLSIYMIFFSIIVFVRPLVSGGHYIPFFLLFYSRALFDICRLDNPLYGTIFLLNRRVPRIIFQTPSLYGVHHVITVSPSVVSFNVSFVDVWSAEALWCYGVPGVLEGKWYGLSPYSEMQINTLQKGAPMWILLLFIFSPCFSLFAFIF